MNPSDPSTRRKRGARPAPEALESRSLMTGGAGNTFAIIPGTIATAGQVAAVKFTIDPTHFHLPAGGKLTLGIDVAPDPTGTARPTIVAVRDASGRAFAVHHATYDPHIPNSKTNSTSRTTTAVLTTLTLKPGSPNAPTTYEVDVKGLQGSTGKVLLGFYLPGDANGDGKVDPTDVNLIKGDVGALSSSSKYSFDADANRNGRIGLDDLRTAEQNLGASTDIAPVVAANLDPAGMVDVSQRATRAPSAHFTGTLTPGAAIKFTETAGKVQPVATTADAQGNYSITVPLGEGSNIFQVTTLDAFGQSISGTLAPVNYSPAPVVTPATIAATAAQAGPNASITVKNS
jgi:hypothetical protein